MKANELMIGDIIRFKHINGNGITNPHEITCIDDFNNEIHADGEIYDLRFWNIEPIPFTSEILEKNGFVVESRENHGHNLQYCILTDGLWIDISGENFFEGKLEYVHQLQHVLRLCGIEKEIEL